MLLEIAIFGRTCLQYHVKCQSNRLIVRVFNVELNVTQIVSFVSLARANLGVVLVSRMASDSPSYYRCVISFIIQYLKLLFHEINRMIETYYLRNRHSFAEKNNINLYRYAPGFKAYICFK